MNMATKTQTKTQTQTNTQTGRGRRAWRRTYRAVLMALSFVALLGMVVSSFSGHVHPTVYPGACVMVMLFPGWLLFLLLMIILDALWCRKALVVCGLAVAVCFHAILDFAPLHVCEPSTKEGSPTFTLLSFNVENFTSQSGEYPDGCNPAISYILQADADVVCIQEAAPLVEKPMKNTVIAQSQIDSLYRRYPYIMMNGYTQMIMSKYPAEAVHTGTASKRSMIGVAHLTIEGVQVALVNVHLQCYSLTHSDKSLYQDLTSANNDTIDLRSGMGLVRSRLLSKIQRAAERRAAEAERIVNYLHKFGGETAIVAGDFNDVPGCYTLHRLADAGMRQVYSEVAFGPAITYYVDRFYFRIDHVLYRGRLKPLSMRIGGSRASDHLPVLTTFAIE